MKKNSIICLLSLMAVAMLSCGGKDDVPEGYVDLGLTSGILWKSQNEEGFIDYEIAYYEYKTAIPSNDYWNELIEECQWQPVNDSLLRVVGPNGNYIELPLDGYHNCSGLFEEFPVIRGCYWSSTPYGASIGWYFYTDRWSRVMTKADKCAHLSVRLVRLPN